MRGLKDKTFLIAGGATGIGAGTAKRLAAEGACVVVGDINIASATATAEQIAQSGGRAVAVEFDLSDTQSVQGLVDRTIEEFGGIDGLHNVGADLSEHNLGRDTTILDTEMAVWRRTLASCCWATCAAIQAVSPTCWKGVVAAS